MSFFKINTYRDKCVHTSNPIFFFFRHPTDIVLHLLCHVAPRCLVFKTVKGIRSFLRLCSCEMGVVAVLTAPFLRSGLKTTSPIFRRRFPLWHSNTYCTWHAQNSFVPFVPLGCAKRYEPELSPRVYLTPLIAIRENQ